MPNNARKRNAPSAEGQLRIIGGTWRGRKLTFPALEGLRPTPDRVRETLFNWLAPVIPGAHCLDLFAGSGALGLEALSRGAGQVDFVDAAPVAVKQLQSNLDLLKSDCGQVSHAQAQQFLSNCAGAYDVIFLDPPFGMGLLEQCVPLLQRPGLLKQKVWVYIETGRDEQLPTLPSCWRLHREKTAGQVCYRLYAVESAALSATE